MLTHVPNPSWRQWRSMWLVRDAALKSSLHPWAMGTLTGGLLSRSMWSIALIAQWRRRQDKSENIRVFVPDYFCEYSLTVLRQSGVDIEFYVVESDMSVDLVALREQCSAKKPDMILMVHFFGIPNSSSHELREIARNHGAWLVEDCAHCLVPTKEIAMQGDFVLFSPHKLLSIPDCAVLLVRPDGPNNFGDEAVSAFGSPETWQIQAKDLAHRLGLILLPAWRQSGVWLLKRFVQRIGLKRAPHNIVDVLSETQEFDRSNGKLCSPMVSRFSRQAIANVVQLPRQSVVSKGLLAGMPVSSDLHKMIRFRQINSSIWDELICELSDGTVWPIKTNVLREIPYMAMYEGSAANILTLYRKLEKLNLPVSTWPDLPNQIRGDTVGHPGANDLFRRRLYLPVHQSLKMTDIQRLLRSVHKTHAVAQRLVVDCSEWEEILSGLSRTNILQAGDYGLAKAMSEGWTVRRIVYSVDGRSIAASQVLERRFVGFCRVRRISRGPLFYPDVPLDLQSAVLREISREGAWYKGTVLSIAPELHAGSVLPSRGIRLFKQLSPIGHESIVLDLSLSNDERRQHLQGKWRNQLVAAEKSDVKIRYSSDPSDTANFELEYKKLIEEKAFNGIPLQLFHALLEIGAQSGSIELLLAELKGENLGAIAIAKHGLTATYLAGWNGPEGRRLNSNNLLLWDASCRLKQQGFLWFDLGGVDETATPAITSFKRGMTGEHYRIIGEYLSL